MPVGTIGQIIALDCGNRSLVEKPLIATSSLGVLFRAASSSTGEGSDLGPGRVDYFFGRPLGLQPYKPM
jgi:hypothetical protein